MTPIPNSSPTSSSLTEHPEATCQQCGGPNVVWFAPNELWNRVMGGPEGIVCPRCFVLAAEKVGIHEVWSLRPGRPAQGAAAPVTEQAGRYRKKPVVIDAFRWVSSPTPKRLEPPYVEGQGGGWRELDAWLVSLGYKTADEADDEGDVPLWVNGDESLTIPTLEGDHRCDIGDWIIRGVKGEFYPCKPDIFALTYEPAVPQGAAAEPTREPDEAQLRKLAENATPGPWRAEQHEAGRRTLTVVESRAYADEEPGVCGSHSSAWPLMGYDAEYIAACSPTAILALLDRLAALRQSLDSAEARIQQLQQQNQG